MIDPFGRKIDYLRISVTDRCDFRCVYCMSEDMTFLPKIEILSLEELDRLCRAFISLGVKKIRITGGEPLVRRNIIWLFKKLSRHLENGDLNELTLTTNGSLLYKYAKDLYSCGVRRINLSLDTLDKDKFLAITRRGKYNKVMEGIKAAKDAGLKIKINTVALMGINNDEIHDLIQYCGDQNFDLTFIEVMPMGDLGNEDRQSQYWPLSDLRQCLEEKWTLIDNGYNTGGPARYVDIKETGGRVGFITPLSHNFCASCNRVRVTCTGMLYMCLGQNDNADLRQIMRQYDDEKQLTTAIKEAISRKPKEHNFIIDSENKKYVPRHMSVTGG